MKTVLVVLGLAALILGGAVVNWEHSQIVDCPSGHCGLEWEALQQLVAEAPGEQEKSQDGSVPADVPVEPGEPARPTEEPPDDDDGNWWDDQWWKRPPFKPPWWKP